MPDNSEPQVPVWDRGASHEVYVPVSEAEAGIREGRYTRQSNTVVTTTAPGGTQLVREPEAGAAVARAGLEPLNTSAGLEAKHAEDVHQRLKQFDNIVTGIQVFLDSLANTASLGLLHRHGEEAELARQEHPGAELAGSVAGFALPNPIKLATPLGLAEKGLGAAAKVIPKAESGLGAIAGAAAREAVVNTGIIAAYDVGHQASDALIEDKPFSGEHIAAQIPLGLMLGGAFGAAGEYVTKFADAEATAKALADQGGIVNPKSVVSANVHQNFAGAVQELDEALQKRSVQAKLMRELADSGSLEGVPQSYFDRVDSATAQAEKAQKALSKHDLQRVMADGDPAEMSRLANAVSSYEGSVAALDHALRPTTGEAGLVAPARGLEPQPGPADYVHVPTSQQAAQGDRWAAEIDARMRANPELAARYKEWSGRDWEFLEPAEAAKLESTGAENLGGQITPTSELQTGMGKRRAVPEEAAVAPTGPEKPTPPPAIVEKLEGGKKARLEDGQVVWRSEHRKMLKDYERKLADYEARAPKEPVGPTTKALPGREKAGSLSDLNAAVDKLPVQEHAAPAPKEFSEADLGPQKAKLARSEPNARRFFDQLGANTHGPLVSPGQKATVKIDHQLQDIEAATGGKLTAARALEAAEAFGVKGAATRTPLADKMVQVWALRRLAETASDVAKNEATRGPANKLIRRLAAHGMAAVGLKHAGPVGFMVGHALGWAANAGSVAGRAKRAVQAAAVALLKNQRARILARTITQHEDEDHHYGYKTNSLRERAELIAHAAQDEAMTRRHIQSSLGNLKDGSPDLARAIEDSTMNRVRNLSMRLPAFMLSGNTSVQEERRFREYENATWNPQVILDAISRGDLSPTLARVLHEQHPELQRVLAEELMANPETVQGLSRRVLRQVEMITGASLTRATDPGFIMRMQMQPPQQAGAQGAAPQGGSQPAQRFKIQAPSPTVNQTTNGRAPGN